jgi:hypothetical protein
VLAIQLLRRYWTVMNLTSVVEHRCNTRYAPAIRIWLVNLSIFSFSNSQGNDENGFGNSWDLAPEKMGR